MNWYVVDKEYINYLKQFDSRVGYVEYGERLKLHIGILLTVGEFNYYVPISMFLFLPRNQNIKKCQTALIFTNYRTKLQDTFTLC